MWGGLVWCIVPALFLLGYLCYHPSVPEATRELRVLGAAKPLRGLTHEGVTKWTFSWPHATDGSCRCQEASWGEYASEETCLRSFASYAHETCTYEGVGVTLEDCQFAVATDIEKDNEFCRNRCKNRVGGTANQWKKFLKYCSLEKYATTSAGSVIVYGNCFKRSIHGHSDSSFGLSVDNLKIAYRTVEKVYSASECQGLCHTDADCDSWFWRRISDKDDIAPYSCYMKNEEMVNSASEVLLPVAVLLTGESVPYDDPIWQSCDVSSMWAQVSTAYRNSTISYCDCACIWQSSHHISGPPHCGSTIVR